MIGETIAHYRITGKLGEGGMGEFRADVAAFRIPWPADSAPELVLDRATLPGFSGSPVYRSDGRVVGVLVRTGTGDAAGITIARPASVLRKLLEDRLSH